MAAYGIYTFDFVRWEGPPPPLVKQHVATFNKIGQPGISAQRTGIHGDPFEAVLTSVFATQFNQIVVEEAYRDLIGTDPVQIKWNNINYLMQYFHLYLVTGVETLRIKAHPLLIGPGYSYAGGYLVQTRWSMIPITA
jgi:hypothetical protein